jgi:hypothetical protein
VFLKDIIVHKCVRNNEEGKTLSVKTNNFRKMNVIFSAELQKILFLS